MKLDTTPRPTATASLYGTCGREPFASPARVIFEWTPLDHGVPMMFRQLGDGRIRVAADPAQTTAAAVKAMLLIETGDTDLDVSGITDPAPALGEQLADADARTLSPTLHSVAACSDPNELNHAADVANTLGNVASYFHEHAADVTAEQADAMAEIARIVNESGDPHGAAAQVLDAIEEWKDAQPIKVRIVAPGARSGPLLAAELYVYDREETEGKPAACVSVWGEPESEAELDVAGTDQLIADLEAALPRLRKLRDQLAAIEQGR